MHQAAGENGTPAAELGNPPPVSAIAGVHAVPSAPLPPPSPRRVCFASPKVVSNPVIQFATPEPLCGQPQRQETHDSVTFEKDLVDCEACQALLSGQKPAEPARSSAALPAPPAPAAVGPVATAPLKVLLDQLDPDQLRERLRELDGERAALQVLLEAAIARQRATES